MSVVRMVALWLNYVMGQFISPWFLDFGLESFIHILALVCKSFINSMLRFKSCGLMGRISLFSRMKCV